jgi:hypothetical protein
VHIHHQPHFTRFDSSCQNIYSPSGNVTLSVCSAKTNTNAREAPRYLKFHPFCNFIVLSASNIVIPNHGLQETLEGYEDEDWKRSDWYGQHGCLCGESGKEGGDQRAIPSPTA